LKIKQRFLKKARKNFYTLGHGRLGRQAPSPAEQKFFARFFSKKRWFA
jgi:hypothetical protein